MRKVKVLIAALAMVALAASPAAADVMTHVEDGMACAHGGEIHACVH